MAYKKAAPMIDGGTDDEDRWAFDAKKRLALSGWRSVLDRYRLTCPCGVLHCDKQVRTDGMERHQGDDVCG